MSIKYNPDRLKPDRYHILNANRTYVITVAQMGLAGNVIALYNAKANEVPLDDPWLLAVPDTDLGQSVEVKSIVS